MVAQKVSAMSEARWATAFTRLGDGLMAVRVVVGGAHSCALLQDASVKCWGWGVNGQLGQGSSETLGDEPWEMGNALRSVNLANRRVLDLSLGFAHTCALLDDDSARCWGSSSNGELGIGTTTNVGAIAGQMGTALLATELSGGVIGDEGLGFTGFRGFWLLRVLGCSPLYQQSLVGRMGGYYIPIKNCWWGNIPRVQGSGVQGLWLRA